MASLCGMVTLQPLNGSVRAAERKAASSEDLTGIFYIDCIQVGSLFKKLIMCEMRRG